MKVDPNNDNLWEYQDKCVHPDCKDGCKLGMGGDTPQPRIQQELREVLKRAYYNGLDRKGWSLYEEQQALEAINSLVIEVLGGNEFKPYLLGKQAGKTHAHVRNQLRQQFLNRWMGKE